MIEVIREFLINGYYTIYLLFDLWIKPAFILILLVILLLSMIRKNKSILPERIWFIYPIYFFLLYIIIFIWIGQTDGLDLDDYRGNMIRLIYYIGTPILMFPIGNTIGRRLFEENKNCTAEIENKSLISKFRIMYGGLSFLSIIPILCISPYVFAKADDYSFSYHCHKAWEATHSIIEVIKAAVVMIMEAYGEWQGTHASIFMMAIQPGVFHERLYNFVPVFFILLLSLSTLYFMKTVYLHWMKADKKYSLMMIGIYIFFAVQCVPVKQSAFIWYNGAVHYMGAYCVMLIFLSMLIQIYVKEYSTVHIITAGITGWYVGGGNFVTAVGMLLLSLTILVITAFTKRWRENKVIIYLLCIFLISMAVNFLAPGNFNKMSNAKGNSLITAFMLAFSTSIEYMFGKWIDWTVFFLLLMLIPIVWNMVRQTNFQFRYPAVVLGYSWCYIASLFFTPLYSISNVEVGRFQNIIFLQYIMLMIFNLVYFIGWMQKKWEIKGYHFGVKLEKNYYRILLFVGVIMFGLSAKAEPEKYTSVYALQSWLTEDYKTYGEEYWNIVEVLNSKDSIISIKDFTNVPSFLHVEESEEWNSGLRLFYNKEKVTLIKK